MSLIADLLAPYWAPIAAALAALAGTALAYLKGRSDANRNAQMKDTRDANEIRRKGADARDRARAGGVSDDGFRRRDP